jgi:hypothetical protein
MDVVDSLVETQGLVAAAFAQEILQLGKRGISGEQRRRETAKAPLALA